MAKTKMISNRDLKAVVGFHDKYPSQNYHVRLLLIAHLELRKPRKLGFATFAFDIHISGLTSVTQITQFEGHKQNHRIDFDIH